MLDPETQEFLTWAFNNMEDEAYFQELVTEAKQRIDTFYQQPKDAILPLLRAKMEKGAIEHGAPSHTSDELNQEMNNEYIDLIGWLLVKRWNDHKEQR